MKKFIGLAAALALTVLGVTIPATTASAHTGDLEATATCQSDGTYLVTYTLTLSSVPNGNTGTVYWRIGTTSFDGTPNNSNGMTKWGTKAGNGTITLGTKTLPGTSTKAPWAYAFTNWQPDNFSKGSDGGDIKLAGNCNPPDTSDEKITLCHATASDSNPYSKVTVSKATFYTGHREHGDDIYPAGSYTKGGHDYSWSAQGDQSLLGTDCTKKPPTKYSEWSSWSNETPTCDNLTVTQTRTREVTTYEWDGKKWAGTTTVEKDTRQVTMTDEQFANQCQSPPPNPERYKEVTESCTAGDGVGGYTTTLSHRDYTWSIPDRKWVPSDKVVIDSVTFTAYTDDEYLAKCAPDKPSKDPLVVTGEFGGAEPTCDNPTVAWTREIYTTTYTYTWNPTTRVYDETATTTHVTDEVTQAHTLTADQIKACHPKVPPTVTISNQTCTIGDQGSPNVTNGQITLGITDGVSTKVTKDGIEVNPITNLAPGTYEVSASLTDPKTSSWGTLPDGWTSNEDGTISYSATITEADLGACTVTPPPPPAPTYTEWVDGSWNCGDTYVAQTRVRTDTTWIWNPETLKWDALVSTATETQNRKLTEPEITTQCTPSPAPDTTYSSWTKGTQKCGSTQIEYTRVAYAWSIPYVIQWSNDGTYTFVLNYDNPTLLSKTTETKTETVEKKVCGTTTLAFTGLSEGTLPIGLAAILAVLFGAGLIAFRHRKA